MSLPWLFHGDKPMVNTINLAMKRPWKGTENAVY